MPMSILLSLRIRQEILPTHTGAYYRYAGNTPTVPKDQHSTQTDQSQSSHINHPPRALRQQVIDKCPSEAHPSKLQHQQTPTAQEQWGLMLNAVVSRR